MEIVCIIVLGLFVFFSLSSFYSMTKDNIIVGILVFALSTLVGFILIRNNGVHRHGKRFEGY